MSNITEVKLVAPVTPPAPAVPVGGFSAALVVDEAEIIALFVYGQDATDFMRNKLSTIPGHTLSVRAIESIS